MKNCSRQVRQLYEYVANESIVEFKVMLHGTIRNNDFSATQYYSIVSTLFRMAATLFQHGNAVLW